jgi:hypothetical protein
MSVELLFAGERQPQAGFGRAAQDPAAQVAIYMRIECRCTATDIL